MSIERMTSVWKLSKEKGAGLLILLSLADRADDDGYCWPSMDDTAKRARVTRRYVLSVVERAVESGELFVNKRSGYSHQYIVPHGMTIQQIRDAMKRRFEWSTEAIENTLNAWSIGCELCSHVNPSSQGGCEPQFTGGVNPSSHESSLTTNIKSSINQDFPFPEDTAEIESATTDYGRLSAAFSTAAKMPMGDNGKRWNEAINELVAMEATPEIVAAAVDLLANSDKGYKINGPWSIVKTARNLMISQERERAKNTQKTGGDWG